MLRIYRAPNGRTYQYEEGEHPAGFVEVKAATRLENKARTTRNKARTPANKTRDA